MDEDCRIIVHMEPHTHDNPQRPYFWCILKGSYDSSSKYGFSNSGCGWAVTPEEAFKDAQEALKRQIKE